jgi:PAS domain S-box-containing protein
MAETALNKIELERKEYEFRLQSILDNTPLMIFIKDLEGKYLLVNKRFKEAFGNGQSLVDKTGYDIDTKENADRFKQADEKVIKTMQPLEVEETIVNQGVTQNLMVVKFPLFDRSGKIFAISGIATDITEKVHYQNHLLETRKNAESAEKLQGEFLANMSHEIRTPMNGIVGMTNLLLQTQIDPEQERFLHIVRHSSDNLLFLINDILDLSKIKAGKMTIESIDFNIKNVMETVIAPFRIKMKERGVELVTNVHPDIPEMLIGDPYRLSQILSNLFSNAIKFTQKGYIKFSVTMIANGDNCTLEFSVEDTGIGIAADKINYIFESFAQASLDTTRKFGGTGLGLSITKQLIELQHGSIDVSSIVDKGTTFSFSIPYKNVPADVMRKAEEKQVIDKEALKGKKILIAEDNEINQMVISFTLKQAGIITTIVNNGKEAVDLLENEKELDFDLIIMDLQMPEMDGFQASTYIRKKLKLQIPIIAMTASLLRDERIKCFEAGMNEYMSKPFKPAELFITISKFLNEDLKKNLAATSNRKPVICLSPYDFNNLYKMMPKQQASEVIGMFVDNTPVLLNKIQTSVLLQSWKEVTTNAQILKSSLELLQLHEMMPDIIDIERMARLNIQLDMIPSILNRLIEYFNTIKPLLEEEKNQLAAI